MLLVVDQVQLRLLSASTALAEQQNQRMWSSYHTVHQENRGMVGA